MSNIPITSLPITNPLTGEEAVPIVQAGTTKRTTTGAISALPFGQGTAFTSGISFVTVSSSFTALPSSRVLAAALPITLTDGGTSAPITIGFSTGTAGYVLTGNGTSLAATFQSLPSFGTVTSVGLSGGTTGLTISNSPITTNGTMTLGGYLNGTAIATASITATQLAANSVASTQLSSNSVTSAKIVDNTVGFSKIQQAAGLSIIGVTGASPANLAAITGTASKVLSTNNAGTGLGFYNLPFVGDNVLCQHKGLVVKSVTVSTVDIDATAVMLADTSGLGRRFDSINLTANIAASGANGLDTGAEAPSTWYATWVIAKEDATVASLLSTSFTAPTLPSDYVFKGLVGAIRNNGSSNFLSYFQTGNRFSQEGVNIVSAGTATSFTSVDLSGVVPPVATECTFYWLLDTAVGTNTVSVFVSSAGTGTTATYGLMALKQDRLTAGSPTISTESCLLSTPQQFVYRAGGTTPVVTITAQGGGY